MASQVKVLHMRSSSFEHAYSHTIHPVEESNEAVQPYDDASQIDLEKEDTIFDPGGQDHYDEGDGTNIQTKPGYSLTICAREIVSDKGEKIVYIGDDIENERKNVVTWCDIERNDELSYGAERLRGEEVTFGVFYPNEIKIETVKVVREENKYDATTKQSEEDDEVITIPTRNAPGNDDGMVEKRLESSLDANEVQYEQIARSYEELTAFEGDIFDDYVSKIGMYSFPEILMGKTDKKATDRDKKKVYEIPNESGIKRFELYHRGYVDVHLAYKMDITDKINPLIYYDPCDTKDMKLRDIPSVNEVDDEWDYRNEDAARKVGIDKELEQSKPSMHDLDDIADAQLLAESFSEIREVMRTEWTLAQVMEHCYYAVFIVIDSQRLQLTYGTQDSCNDAQRLDLVERDITKHLQRSLAEQSDVMDIIFKSIENADGNKPTYTIRNIVTGQVIECVNKAHLLMVPEAPFPLKEMMDSEPNRLRHLVEKDLLGEERARNE
eukprot:163395_1